MSATPLSALARLLLAILATLAALGCAEREPAPSGAPLKLTIADSSQPFWALLYIAEAKGFFKEAGLDVTFESFSLGKDALESALQGKSDLATVLEGPVATKIYEGRDVAILTTLYTSTRNQAVLARHDRGIWKAADLRGKKIGLSLGTAQEYMLSVFLATEGIPAASIKRVHVGPADYEKALLDGTVDAVIAFNPYQTRLRKALGEGGVTFYFDAYVENALLVGRREIVAGKPEAMTRLVKALARAQDYLERNREESVRITVARFAGRFDESAIREAWNDVRLEMKLDNVLVSTMALEGQWMKSGKFSGPVPDFRSAMVAGYLRTVRPEAVTLATPGTAR